jgi:hypothetical protein
MYVFAYYAQAGYGGYCCHGWLAHAEAKLFVVGLDVVLSRERYQTRLGFSWLHFQG